MRADRDFERQLPRRAVVGWDASRLSMLLAVLDTRCGLRVSAADVYLNIAGGLRVNEPAADLAVAAALASAATGEPTSAGMVYFGEVGLSGEVRQVAHAEARLKEAAKLGFEVASLPGRVARGRRALAAPPGLALVEVGHLSDLVTRFGHKARYPGYFSTLHALDVDSYGNVYTGEVRYNNRIQKFLPQ